VTGDRAIRWATTVAVAAVATIAAVVSYSHIYDLGHSHGQSGTAARLLPLSVDGLIVAASLVLLQAARNDRRAPALARFTLWLGIGTTIAANLAYGVPYGPVGAAVSAWPGAAFVLGAEILLGMLRRGVPETAPAAVPELALETVPGAVPYAVPDRTPVTVRRAPGPLPQTRTRVRGVQQPEVVFAAEIEAGKLPSVRMVKSRMMCGQDKAVQIRQELADRLSAPSDIIEATA
jgi:Protein of unknown function (DUF2637)